MKPGPKPKHRKCSIEGCGKPHWARNYCWTHYYRFTKGLDLYAPIKRVTGGTIHYRGYQMIYVNGKQVLEHRHLMEKKLKRKLSRYEIVHHKNGDKLDNRLSNLEVVPLGKHTTLHHKGIPKPKLRGNKYFSNYCKRMKHSSLS